MRNDWQPYIQQLHQAEAEHAAQADLPLDSALLMMARYLVNARRSQPQRQPARNIQRPASGALAPQEYQLTHEFDK
jgi:hypothetical protein